MPGVPRCLKPSVGATEVLTDSAVATDALHLTVCDRNKSVKLATGADAIGRQAGHGATRGAHTPRTAGERAWIWGVGLVLVLKLVADADTLAEAPVNCTMRLAGRVT